MITGWNKLLIKTLYQNNIILLFESSINVPLEWILKWHFIGYPIIGTYLLGVRV